MSASQPDPRSNGSTPGSEKSEDEAGVVGNTTVTTELVGGKNDAHNSISKQSVTFTHQGIKGE